MELCAGAWGVAWELPSRGFSLKGWKRPEPGSLLGLHISTTPKGREYLIIMSITFRAEHLPRGRGSVLSAFCKVPLCSQQSREAEL